MERDSATRHWGGSILFTNLESLETCGGRGEAEKQKNRKFALSKKLSEAP